MIELLRYRRYKETNNVSAKVDAAGDVVIEFDRFDVSTGKKVEPELSVLSRENLVKKLAELKAESEVVEELLGLYKKE